MKNKIWAEVLFFVSIMSAILTLCFYTAKNYDLAIISLIFTATFSLGGIITYSG